MTQAQARETAKVATALLQRQMPGPWMWAGTPEDVRLCTRHSGRHYLLGARRCGMRGTQFLFQFFDGPHAHVMRAAHRDGLYRPRADYAPREIVGIDHPLADLIKMIPEMVAALEALAGGES